ncbi:MAG: class I SAM-dependent methyltransferase [Myxococcota bacterium]
MREHFCRIYQDDADRYERLIGYEDHAHEVEQAVLGCVSLEQADVVELGAGTGRLTRWLVKHARTLRGFDQSAAMLEVARRALVAQRASNWSLSVADHRQLPLSGGVADVAIEGWAFGHLVEDAEPWLAPARDALREMRRVVRPGGALVLLETLGTGVSEPAPPNDRLGALYEWLERDEGFERIVIRTDYAFPSVDEAEALCRFFFGDALADRVRRDQLQVVPECTGLWWRCR